MEKSLIVAAIVVVGAIGAAFLYWRYFWFFRNPRRTPPPGDGILCPADGTVVYVKTVEPHEEVISIKKGNRISVNGIVRERLDRTVVLIGVFMSPFDVHYNRSPLPGYVGCIRHHSAPYGNLAMGSMHWRSLRNREPHHENSPHIAQNERTVTRIDGAFRETAVSCYLVQIAGKNVDRIVSYFKEGEIVDRGEVFGLIRLGSQVDMVVPWLEGMQIRVKPGDKVRAGETVFID